MNSPVTSAVVLSEVVRQFGSARALDAMSWAAQPAQVTTILGPNGAGKTTAIACAEGLQRPDGGSVRVLGADPWRAGADHRARVGVMLQDGGLPGGSKPVRLLRTLAALYAVSRTAGTPHTSGTAGGAVAANVRVDELVQRLGIDAFASTTIRRLSGGQKQRVALAAALVGAPDVAFLDEPTAGLDPHARLEVWDLVRETSRGGCAVVVTTHSFEEAERLADHVVIVDRGRVVADGTLAEVTANQTLEHVFFERTRTAS
jgi:ABC-2 type transport system ATP-binding protein